MIKKRNTLKKIAGVGAVASLAPNSWTKPIVSSVILPAHAQTSMVAPLVTVTATGPVLTRTDQDGGVEIVADASGNSGGLGDVIVTLSVNSPFTLTTVIFTSAFLNNINETVQILDSDGDIVGTFNVLITW